MQLIRLIWPVILVILISLLALIAVASFFANQYDRDAQATQRTIIENAISKVSHNLNVLAEDNSWWDDAVHNMVVVENMAWIERTIGDISSSRNYVDGSVIMRADNSILYHSDDAGEPVAFEGWLGAGLQTAINNMVFINDNVGISKQGLLKYKGGLIALGMSFIQPSGYTVYDPPLSSSRRPILILYQYIQDTEYTQLAEDTGISEMTFSLVHPENSDHATMQVYDINGNIAGFVSWKQHSPGNELLENLSLPAIFLLMVVLLTASYFLYQARTLIEKLEHANNARMSFLATMSHEVRTPLNTIIGFAEIIGLELYGKLEGKKNKEYIEIIRNSGEHLLSIVNDILDMSKLEAGRFEVDADPIDTREVIEQCLKIVSASASKKSIRLISDLAPTAIESDARIMRQTVVNILSNAIKFTPNGGQVSILSEQKVDRFIITISDNGSGMSQEEIQIALEPFGQVRSSHIKANVGTGLGLPIVDRFMRLIGGKLTIRSAPGYGTSVTLEFPYQVDKQQQP